MLRLFSFFLSILEKKRKRQWVCLSLLVAFAGVIEFGALGLLALFMTSLTSFDQVMCSRFIVIAKACLGERWFVDSQTFYISLGSLTLCLVLFKNIVTGLHNYITVRFEGAMNRDVGVKMLRSFMQAPYGWSSTQNPSDVHCYVEWRLFAGFLPGHLMSIFSDVVISLLLVSSLFFFEPAIMLCVVLVLGGVGGGLFLLFRNRIALYGSRAQDLFLKNAKISLRNINGLREIKAFNVIDQSLEGFGERLRDYAKCIASQRVYERAAVWSLESIGLGGIIIGSILMKNSSGYSSAKMIGTLTLVAVSAWRILPSVSRSVSTLGTIRGYTPYLEKMYNFFKTMERYNEVDKADRLTLPSLHSLIKIDDVSYAYEGAEIDAVSGVSLSVACGEMIGIIGSSGAGKSTFVDVLIGFLKPSNGAILIDGTYLDASTEQSWRDQIGLVPQHPYFFEGSVSENIALRFCSELIDAKRIAKCCNLAGLDDFIHALPKGVDSQIGERGTLLSGGQAQRVAIARALYREPQVLIFDEATSSLDENNERLIRETILGLQRKQTIFIIAHRLETVQHCDKVLWLDKGKVVDFGSPEEILPRYSESFVEANGK